MMDTRAIASTTATPRPLGPRVWLVALAAVALKSTGCSYFANANAPQRFHQGYTIVLPGIEGTSLVNSNLASGLIDGGVAGAIEVHDWTTRHPLMLLVHLRNLARNRREAGQIARKIVEYQNWYPGRPVHLVGHSGGGGMALLALEALPPGRRVTSVLLLAPAVSPDYDLSAALAKTELGIWNFHSPLDTVLLMAGTTVAGTMDGKHTIAAGAIGFLESENEETGEHGWPRRAELHQVPYDWSMVQSHHLGGHLGWTNRRFARDYLAPILQNHASVGRSVPPAAAAVGRWAATIR